MPPPRACRRQGGGTPCVRSVAFCECVARSWAHPRVSTEAAGLKAIRPFRADSPHRKEVADRGSVDPRYESNGDARRPNQALDADPEWVRIS
jgi:hypothetical protein